MADKDISRLVEAIVDYLEWEKPVSHAIVEMAPINDGKWIEIITYGGRKHVATLDNWVPISS